jgi:AsmA protein
MRFLVLIGGAVAAVFVLGAVLLMLMVDPNKYKSDIAALVKAKTGRELTFEGDVRLTYFPRLGLETGGVRLSNPPGFDDKPFSRVRAAKVSIKLLPLLQRRVEVGRVALDGLELHLEKDENGRASWADFVGGENATQAAPGVEPEGAQNATASPAATAQTWGLADLSLDGVRITDSSVTWEDRLLGDAYSLSGLDVDMEAIRPGRPGDFKAAFTLGSAKPELTAQVTLSGTATLNAADSRHIFSNLNLAAKAQGPSVPGGKGEFTLGLSELKIDDRQHTATGAGLVVSAYGAKGQGQFFAANTATSPEVKGRLDFPDFNGRELSAALTGKAANTADATAYQHITAAVEFRAGRGYLEIPNFSASLDDARVEGRLRSVGLEAKAYSFNVRLSGFDADRFLPASSAGAPEPTPPPGATSEAQMRERKSAEKDALFPVEKLRAARIDGQITAERLKYKGLRFAWLKLPVMSQNGILDIGPAEARLYDGGLQGSLRVDVQGDRPALSLNLAVTNVRLKPLFSDISGKESRYEGVMSLAAVSPLVCQGNTVPALKRSLGGRVRVSVRDGVFPGVNMLNVAQGSQKGHAAPAEAGAEKSTRFGSIDATAGIIDGVAHIEAVDFKAPFLRADGKGTVDIATKQTDCTLRLRLVPSSEGQGGGSGVIGLVVPLRVTGPYDNLNFGTDYLRSIGKTALDAVGGVVQGIGEVLTGKKGPSGKSSGGLLEGVKKLF